MRKGNDRFFNKKGNKMGMECKVQSLLKYWINMHVLEYRNKLYADVYVKLSFIFSFTFLTVSNQREEIITSSVTSTGYTINTGHTTS